MSNTSAKVRKLDKSSQLYNEKPSHSYNKVFCVWLWEAMCGKTSFEATCVLETRGKSYMLLFSREAHVMAGIQSYSSNRSLSSHHKWHTYWDI